MYKYLKQIYSKDTSTFFSLLKKDLKTQNKRFIVTVNPETLMLAKSDEVINKILLDKSVTLVPDGIAIVKACSKLKIDVSERITGIDIAKFLLEEANNQKKSIYLYGAKDNVLNSLVINIKNNYPKIKLVGYTHGYVDDRNKVFEDIKKKKPDICMVALGIPQQEKLIYEHIKDFSSGIFMGVGGTFDVLSGEKKRAPKIFIKLNLEWLYRIIKEPKRLKRFWKYNIKFMFNIKRK